MYIRALRISALAALLLVPMSFASADALSVSCQGVPTSSSITWSASAQGGVAPYAYLWDNGSTSTSETLSYPAGTYDMSVTVTDATSSVATSTCSATVAPAEPVITAFSANPASITSGQSSVLSWTVSNASSVSIDNGVGAVSGASVTVSPSVSTTYTLTAANSAGTTTAQAAVSVSATSTPTGTSLQDQINALLAQIRTLQQQLVQLVASRGGSTTGTPSGTGTSTPPIMPPGQVGKAACISLNRDLGEGDSGSDVMSVQQMLAQNPAYGFNVTPTGYFGPLTARAMVRYQEDNGIASSSAGLTGYVGPLTRGFFQRRCGEGLSNGGGASSRAGEGENSNAASSSQSNSSSIIPFGSQFRMGHGNEGEGRGNGRGNGNNGNSDN